LLYAKGGQVSDTKLRQIRRAANEKTKREWYPWEEKSGMRTSATGRKNCAVKRAGGIFIKKFTQGETEDNDTPRSHRGEETTETRENTAKGGATDMDMVREKK